MNPQDSPTREQFYRGKHVVHEEWFVNDGDLVSWARLRVFSDGMADVWDYGELWGFVNEACARFSIREGHYVHPSRVASPRSDVPTQQADAIDQPFRWGGDWCTGLAEPGATPDPAGYMLYPVDGSSHSRELELGRLVVNGLGHGIPRYYNKRKVSMRLPEELAMPTDASIEQRLAAVEKELAALKARVESTTPPLANGWDRLIGSMENNPAFEEAMEFVRQAREADRLLQENGQP